jgi:hypothetical protein
VLKFIQLIERTEFVSGEFCIVVRGIQRGRMVYRQREECDRQREEISMVRRTLGKTRSSDK